MTNLLVGMLTQFEQSGIKLWQRTSGKDFEQVCDDPWLLFSPEALEDSLQIDFAGVPPPATEPETLAFALGCSEDLLDGNRSHSLFLRKMPSLFGLSLLVSQPAFPKSVDRSLRGFFQQLVDAIRANALDGGVNETSVITFPFPIRQQPPAHSCGEKERLVTVQLDDFLFTEPRAIGEWFLFNDLVQACAKCSVSPYRVTAGEFAKLVGVVLVGQIVERMEDRHTEPILGPDRSDHLPDPVAPGILDLPIEPLVPKTRLQEWFVVEPAVQGPLHSPPQTLPQGVPLLVRRRASRW
jgi:hypothetical protein